jgi:ResB-like family protein
MRRTSSRIWDALASLKLTIACLVLLMVLVVACTLAEVRLGTFAAVNAYIRSFFIYWNVPGTGWSIPVFPGGGLVGLVLTANLVVAQVRRLEMSIRKLGLWIVHLGLVLLFAGEFVTSALQVETQLAIEEGQTLAFVDSPREMEVAVVDTTDPDHDDVYVIPESLLVPGRFVEVPGTPLFIKVKAFLRNAQLGMRATSDPPSLASAGIGPAVAVREVEPVIRDDEIDHRALFIEPFAGPRSYGTWLLSNVLRSPQSFVHEGRTYALSLRNRREYLPFAMTLKQFRHDVYPGTDIPKNFSSLVHLSRPSTGEERDVLISMNQPLRYGGKAFYQESFGRNDTLSILQVVENPGWVLPYASCVLVAAGLLFHFALSLRRSFVRRRVALEPA